MVLILQKLKQEIIRSLLVQGPYTSIVGTGETNQPLVQADSYITSSTPIGFTFNFEGVAYTSFKASSNGFLSFSTGTNYQTNNNLDGVTSASRPLVAPLWDDHDGNATGGSIASFVVTGTTTPIESLHMNGLIGNGTTTLQTLLFLSK